MIIYLLYSIIVMAAIAVPMTIGYFLVKKAVKIAIKEAIKEANIRTEVREGMREILREVDYRAMAKIFAEENKKMQEKE